jgi:hypothetical protein
MFKLFFHAKCQMVLYVSVMLQSRCPSIRTLASWARGQAQLVCWRTFTASRKLDASTTSQLHLVAFSTVTPALPARRGHFHRATCLPRPPPTSRRASSPPLGSGRSQVPLAGRVNPAATPVCGQATRRGGCRWPGLGQAQAQLAAARPRPASQNRPFPALLCAVQKKKVEKHMLQAYVSSVSDVPEVCCKCFMWMFYMLQWLYTYVASVFI